ncbi:hypothetical protein J6S55_00900 [Candidatus Saccharibacteria bacterium]|nr:hypothetical protein [Candidatus Saccharibacteria bacterium]
MAKEINLVPDIKNEFLKTLKFRNFVFFLCIVVASSSLIVTLIFLSISGGQQGFITAKQNTLKSLEQKINEYSDLSDFLTIRDQLGNIASITDNKVMLSRTFNVLAAIIPTGADYINISELSVGLSGDAPTFTFDAQANSGTEPFIDYNVLDSFKKSMAYMRYDYGEYVDKNGDSIPAYCMIESNQEGATLRDAEKGYYAYWLINGEGCNPAAKDEEKEEEESDEEESENTESSTPEPTAAELSQATGYNVEEWNGQKVVKIWRTPQFVDWYKENPKDDEPYMSLDGSIENVPHFNSSCIKYFGEEKENNTITWSVTNDSCKLVPDSDEEGTGGIKIDESSNGRDANEQLVLRFSATITFAPEVFNFNNHHMLALSPAGRRNVTDSYAQIQGMFAERAADCQQDDTVCITTPTGSNNEQQNKGGEE